MPASRTKRSAAAKKGWATRRRNGTAGKSKSCAPKVNKAGATGFERGYAAGLRHGRQGY